MKAIIKTVMLSVFFVACSTDDTPAGQQLLVAPEPQEVAKGDLYGNGQEGIPQQFLVISNQMEWESLKAQMDAVNSVTENFVETEIDFSQYTLIAAFDQIRGTGGHSIDITSIDETPDMLHVTVEKLLNGNLTAVMTQPYHIVKIPATTKAIVFN